LAGAPAPTTEIALDVACFRTGTRITTPRGPLPVEALGVGDRVVTVSGAVVPIVWAGLRRVDCRSHRRPETVWPVRVRAGAFGPGVPGRDLFLSPDHAVYVDGELIPVKYLTNGVTIEQIETDCVTYHHVELPEHDIILAEGLPCESYLDTGDRSEFSQRSRTTARSAKVVARTWETMGRAKLIVTGDRLSAAHGLVGER